MKKFLFLALLAGLFTLMSTSSVDAQNLGNRTQCDIEMKIDYGWPGCVPVGTFSIDVPAYSVIAIPLPPGMIIIRAEGAYIGTTCVFEVGVPCTGLPNPDFVPCGTACGDYKAELIPTWGVVAYH
ncbi:MAG: hypothetical protein AAGG75_10165 [Bacteroidota bacterium]